MFLSLVALAFFSVQSTISVITKRQHPNEQFGQRTCPKLSKQFKKNWPKPKGLKTLIVSSKRSLSEGYHSPLGLMHNV
jgi:hypothetical protein